MKRYAFVKAAQGVALLVAAFVLLRVVAPWLVDLHNTPALILAGVLLIGGAFVVGWFAWSFFVPMKPRRDVSSSEGRVVILSKRNDPNA